jgi:hypothetical protein
MRVTVTVQPADTTNPTTKIGAYLVTVLDRLGYHASLRTTTSAATLYQTLNDSRSHVQIGWFNWYQDFPRPLRLHQPPPHLPRVPTPQSVQPQRLRVLRPRHRQGYPSRASTRADSTRLGHPNMGDNRPEHHQPSTLAPALQPPPRHRDLGKGRQLPVPPLLRTATRPAMGALTTREPPASANMATITAAV